MAPGQGDVHVVEQLQRPVLHGLHPALTRGDELFGDVGHGREAHLQALGGVLVHHAQNSVAKAATHLV